MGVQGHSEDLGMQRCNVGMGMQRWGCRDVVWV